jgi:hypothetical protein
VSKATENDEGKCRYKLLERPGPYLNTIIAQNGKVVKGLGGTLPNKNSQNLIYLSFIMYTLCFSKTDFFKGCTMTVITHPIIIIISLEIKVTVVKNHFSFAKRAFYFIHTFHHLSQTK